MPPHIAPAGPAFEGVGAAELEALGAGGGASGIALAGALGLGAGGASGFGVAGVQLASATKGRRQRSFCIEETAIAAYSTRCVRAG